MCEIQFSILNNLEDEIGISYLGGKFVQTKIERTIYDDKISLFLTCISVVLTKYLTEYLFCNILF